MKALLAVVILALAGCASFSGSSATEKLIVQTATMKFIEAGDDRAARAAKIRAAVDQARVWLDTDGVTLADLHAAIMGRLASANLEPSDMLLASALVDVVVAELNARIGDGILDEDKRVRVNAVLGWIAEAASFYG